MKKLLYYKTFETTQYKDELYKNFIQAVKDGDIETVKNCIISGVDVNKINEQGLTALMYAVTDIDIVKELIKAGADVNIKSGLGWSVTMYAIHHNKYDVVFELLNAGADINVTDISGRSLLYYAIKYTSVPFIEDIIRKGIDLTIRDKQGLNFIEANTDSGYLRIEALQEIILTHEPSLISSLVKSGIDIHPNILKKYPYLSSGVDLNLL